MDPVEASWRPRLERWALSVPLPDHRRDLAATASYRDSHTDPAAVAAYVSTCTRGYYAVLWEAAERNLVERCLCELAHL